MERAERVSELFVYRLAYASAIDIFRASKAWPAEERYALTDQVRRSSRSVCANLGEAWARRRYPRHFARNVCDAIAEAEETVVWLHFSVDCGYEPAAWMEEVVGRYDRVIAGLVRSSSKPERWAIV